MSGKSAQQRPRGEKSEHERSGLGADVVQKKQIPRGYIYIYIHIYVYIDIHMYIYIYICTYH